MTYEERERQLCNNCEAKENCSYISRNLENKCSFKETTMYGWELGYNDAIDKACEWLEKNACNYEYSGGTCDSWFSASDLVESFRKYMEEQQ